MRFRNENVEVPLLPQNPTGKFSYIGIKRDVTMNDQDYFNLGVKPTTNTNVILCLNIKYPEVQANNTNIFGVNGGMEFYNPQNAYGNRVRRTDSLWFEPSYNAQFTDMLFEMQYEQDYYFKFDQTSDNDYFQMKASTTESDLDSNVITTYEKAQEFPDVPFGLFNLKCPYESTGWEYGDYPSLSGTYIRFVKIYENDVLTHHFVPDLLNNEEPVLKDIITRNIIRCEGDYTKYECLE